MSEEVATAIADAPTIARQAAEIAELRRALNVALAELERSRPVMIAAIRLVALYAALFPPDAEF